MKAEDTVGAPADAPVESADSPQIAAQVSRLVRAIPWVTAGVLLIAGLAFTIGPRLAAPQYFPLTLALRSLDDAGTGSGAVIDRLLLHRIGALPAVRLSDSTDAGRARGVELKTSMRRDADGWRFTARIERADVPVWSYDLLATDAEAHRIVDVATAAVRELSRARAPVHLLMSPGASGQEMQERQRQLYLRARTDLAVATPGYTQRVLRTAQSLIELSPEFAAGHALRSMSCALDSSEQPAALAVLKLRCAHESLDEAVRLAPAMAETHSAAGLLSWVEAERCADPSCNRASLLASATRSLERAVAADAQLLEVHEWLGKVYMARGDLRQAAREAEAAQRLDPMDEVRIDHVARALTAQGRHAELHALILPLLEEPVAHPKLWIALAESAAQTGDVSQSMQWAMRALSSASHSDSGPAVAAAQLCLRFGQPTQARAILTTWPVLHLDTPEQYVAQAWNAYWLGGAEEVGAFIDSRAQIARRLDDVKPGRVAQLARGMALYLAGRKDESQSLLAAALGTDGPMQIDASNLELEIDAAHFLAAVERERGNLERSAQIAASTLQWLERVQSQGFGEVSAFATRKALALALAGQQDESAVELQQAIDLGWSSPLDLYGDPRWSAMHRQPEFEAAVARVEETAERKGIRLAGIAGLHLAHQPQN